MKSLNKYICLLLLFLSILIIGGCYSPQEKRGVSNMPQNSPSKWENRFKNNAPDGPQK